jgi:hypothetical protein
MKRQPSVQELVLEKLNKIDEKVERLDSRQDSMDKSMAVYNEQLRIHIAGVKEAREQFASHVKEEFAPVKKHVDMMNFTFKAIGFLFTATIAVLGAIQGGQALISWIASNF